MVVKSRTLSNLSNFNLPNESSQINYSLKTTLVQIYNTIHDLCDSNWNEKCILLSLTAVFFFEWMNFAQKITYFSAIKLFFFSVSGGQLNQEKALKDYFWMQISINFVIHLSDCYQFGKVIIIIIFIRIKVLWACDKINCELLYFF